MGDQGQALVKAVTRYSDVVGKHGPDSAESIACRQELHGMPEFEDYANAVDQLKRRFSGIPDPKKVAERAERDALRARVTDLEAFARAHERWEANVLNDGAAWVDEMISDDEFHEVQALRIKAMKT